jgi:hypothetical protein
VNLLSYALSVYIYIYIYIHIHIHITILSIPYLSERVLEVLPRHHDGRLINLRDLSNTHIKKTRDHQLTRSPSLRLIEIDCSSHWLTECPFHWFSLIIYSFIDWFVDLFIAPLIIMIAWLCHVSTYVLDVDVPLEGEGGRTLDQTLNLRTTEVLVNIRHRDTDRG